MNDNLRTQKDNLAKLMASENITVIHDQVPTAYFDVKNRVLCCPIFKKEISSELYDLFMGHEVSHALHTPLEGLHKTLHENRTLKGYLNVVEDVRIEKMIKDKFPGLRRSFYTAYNELMEMDFFGIKGKNLQLLSLIDKINLITKCGARVNIKLTNEEQVWLDKAMACKTWEDVVKVAEGIYAWSEENEEKDKPAETDKINDSEEGDIVDGLPDGDSDNEENESDDNGSPSKSNGVGDTEEEIDGQQQSSARQAITEENAHQYEHKLYDTVARGRKHVELDKWDVSEEYKNVYIGVDELQKELDKWDKNDPDSKFRIEAAKFSYQKLVKKNEKVVNHMVKEFEMRKQAHISKRAQSAKTGRIDLNKLTTYQFNEDLFKRVTWTPEGKNHGLYVLLDHSGSITDILSDILEQAVVLMMFCKKLNIPYRVLSFTNSYDKRDRDYNRQFNALNLLEFGSNEFTKTQQKSAETLIGLMYNSFKFWNSWYDNGREHQNWFQGFDLDGDRYYYRYTIPPFLNLGSTPLNTAIIWSRFFLPKFKKQYGLDIVHTTIITDGYSDRFQFNEYDKDSFIVDPITKKSYVVEGYNGDSRCDDTKNLLEWLKDTTNTRVSGYFIVVRKNEFRNAVWNLVDNRSYSKSEEDWKEVRKVGKVYSTKGFTKLFFAQANVMKTQDDNLSDELQGQTKRKLLTAFKNNQSSKFNSRYLMSKFVEEIA